MASAKEVAQQHAGLEPGFGSAIIVLVALFVLWVIATKSWTQLALAWQELWDVGRLTQPPGGAQGPNWPHLPSGSGGSMQWTPSIANMDFNVGKTA